MASDMSEIGDVYRKHNDALQESKHTNPIRSDAFASRQEHLSHARNEHEQRSIKSEELENCGVLGRCKIGSDRELHGAHTSAEGFTPGLKAGKGPYQAFRARGEVVEDSKEHGRYIKQATGRSQFLQGERFKVNEDGSVTSRLEKNGRYSEITSADGHKIREASGDKHGNWKEACFDEAGRVRVLIDGKADGSYSRRAYDESGKEIATSSIQKRIDGSEREWASNGDSSKIALNGQRENDQHSRVEHTPSAKDAGRHDAHTNDSNGSEADRVAGMVKFTGLHGAAVDTDGSGAKNHREDRKRQNQTTLRDGHGHSLDTDRDKFVALPRDEMRKKGIQLGDHGYLERADTGEKVPVVFGDVSSGKEWKHGKGQPEASVAALQALGFNNVNGARGVDKSVAFNLTMAPNSRHSEVLNSKSEEKQKDPLDFSLKDFKTPLDYPPLKPLIDEIRKNIFGDRQGEQKPSAPHTHNVSPERAPEHLARPGDATQEVPRAQPASEAAVKRYELFNMEHSSGNNSKFPDAVVMLSPNFDSSKPIGQLIVANHGFYSSAHSAAELFDMKTQMANAPPNSVGILPEWQKYPTAQSSDQGNFAKPGMFKGMINEAFGRIPELKGKTTDDVAAVELQGHSAGNVPTITELYRNGLGNKVKSVNLYDALYRPEAFDPWLKDNVRSLADGTKHFNNIFTYGTNSNGKEITTASASKAQAERLESMFHQAGLPTTDILKDYKNPGAVLNAHEFVNHSVVFKQSSANTSNLGAHSSVPKLYFGRIERASTQW